MRIGKTMIRRREVKVVIGVVALVLLAVAARAVVRQVTCPSPQNEPTSCNYLDVAAQPTPIPSPIQTAIAGVCASGLMKGCSDAPAATPPAAYFCPGETVKGGGRVYRQGGRKVDHFGGLMSQAGGGRA
jgi:hypothetical protein